MSQVSASHFLRLAGWGLSLLLLTSFGSLSHSTAEPTAVASSVFVAPVDVLDQLQTPDIILVPAPTPEPTPTPSPTPTSVPTPTAVPTPSSAPALQPPPSPPPPPPPPPPPQRYADTAAAAAIVALTNELRAQNGLPPLAPNGALDAAARGYAESMAINDWFAHEGPDGSTFTSRATAAGYTGWSYLAENLYRGSYGDSAASIIQAWAASSGHLSNMLSAKATEIGVGCYVSGSYRWCAQELGAR